MTSSAKTVDQYLETLPEDRRKAIQVVREVVRKNLDRRIEEGMQYGMIGYYVPHKVYPRGYHCNPEQPLPFAGLASQKNHMSFYLMSVYGSKELKTWLRKEWAKSGKKLDMGQCCIRFKKLEDLPLELVGRAVAKIGLDDYIAHYESAIKPPARKATAASKSRSVKTPKKKVSTTKPRARRRRSA